MSEYKKVRNRRRTMAKDETVSDVCVRINVRIGELWEKDLGSMKNGEVDDFALEIQEAHKR